MDRERLEEIMALLETAGLTHGATHPRLAVKYQQAAKGMRELIRALYPPTPKYIAKCPECGGIIYHTATCRSPLALNPKPNLTEVK